MMFAERQWGVQYPDGKVVQCDSEEDARRAPSELVRVVYRVRYVEPWHEVTEQSSDQR